MSVEIAQKQNILVTDSNLLKSLLVVFGFGSQAFVCKFSRQNICSVTITLGYNSKDHIRIFGTSMNITTLKLSSCWVVKTKTTRMLCDCDDNIDRFFSSRSLYTQLGQHDLTFGAQGYTSNRVQIIAAQKFDASDNFLMGVGLCIMSQQKQDPFFDILVKTVANTYRPFILQPLFQKSVGKWFKKSASRNLLREIWFEKSG